MSEATWAGTVAGSEVVFVDVRLEVNGELVHHESRAESFVLRLHEGHAVKVFPNPTVVCAEPREISGRFGDLVDDPLAQAVLDAAPGDHVEVRLVGLVVRGGDRIVVGGFGLEKDVPGDGYRDSGTRRVVEIDIGSIAAGDDPSVLPSLVEEEPRPEAPPPEPQPRHGFGIGAALVATVAGIGVLAFTVFRQGTAALPGPSAAAPWVIGIGLASYGIFVARRRRWMPELRAMGRDHDGEGMTFHVFAWILFFSWIFVAAAAFAWFSSDHSADLQVVRGSLALAFVMPLVFAAVVWWSERKDVGLAARLLRVPPLESLGNKKFGWFEGRLLGEIKRHRSYTLDSARMRVDRVHASGRVTTKEHRTSSYSWNEWFAAPEHLRVQTDAGEVVVRTRGGLFASARRSLEGSAGEVRSVHRTPDSSATSRDDDMYVERGLVGDRVLVIGRVQKEGDEITFVARGPESLALYAVPPNRSPRAALRAALLWHVATIGALVSLSALGAWVLWRLP